MTAALICVISVVAFAQFFLVYCKLVLVHSAAIALSPDVRLVLGIPDAAAGPDDFGRILGLLWLCSAIESDRGQIGAIRLYFAILQGFHWLFRDRGISVWAAIEQQRCSHFAAVALDKRISLSREFCA